MVIADFVPGEDCLVPERGHTISASGGWAEFQASARDVAGRVVCQALGYAVGLNGLSLGDRSNADFRAESANAWADALT